ncbi:MAG: sugar transporter [Proteobacteria bacterium]|nr:MAG: sugar transporter [Pseudomonadota bacterium]
MRAWIPTFCISFAAFIFVTSEFIPVGLLPDMARGLGRTESQTGTLMTIYAWIVAVLSLPLTAYTARLNRRSLMLWLLGIFVFAHVIAAIGSNFNLLVLSRTFVASAHAVFWGIATPLGIRLAPIGKREQAMSVVATGATLGSVLGIPLGTFVGQLLGWQFSFGAIGVVAAVIFLVLLKFLPTTPSKNTSTFSSIGPLLKRKDLWLVYLLTVVLMTGHFSAFTFITPYLQQVGHLPAQLVSIVLLAFGLAGLTGGFIAPKLLRDHFRMSAFIALAVVSLSLLLLKFSVSTFPTTILLVIVWGVSFVFFNLVLQNLILTIAPEAEDVAMAGYSGIYNIGIGGGALIGSLSAVHHLESIGYIGAVLVAISFGVFLMVKFKAPQFTPP